METSALDLGAHVAFTAVQQYVTAGVATHPGALLVTVSPVFGHTVSPSGHLRLSAIGGPLVAVHTNQVLSLKEASMDLDRITRPTQTESQPLSFEPDDYPLGF
jgi:hypothetical protein